MHSNHTATAELVLEDYGAGYAWLRPAIPALCAPRSEWPTFRVQTETIYEVAAPTAERALRWFADDSDMDLDVKTLDFGTVGIIDDDVRYWITDKGRHALLGENSPLCQVCGKPSSNSLRAGGCIGCALLRMA